MVTVPGTEGYMGVMAGHSPLVSTLRAGMIDVQTDGKVYWLRPRILELGYAYLSSLSLPEIAQPHMERLVQEVHETCSLGVLDGSEVVFVNRVFWDPLYEHVAQRYKLEA